MASEIATQVFRQFFDENHSRLRDIVDAELSEVRTVLDAILHHPIHSSQCAKCGPTVDPLETACTCWVQRARAVYEQLRVEGQPDGN
jgi:hypothetical protein